MVKKYFIPFLFLLLLANSVNSYCQQAPTLTPVTDDDKYCLSDVIPNDRREFTLNVNPYASLLPNNQFVVELSKDNFITVVTLEVIETKVATPSSTSSNVTLTLKFPKNTYGENYKLRINTTAPAAIRPLISNKFIAYYLNFNTPFSINDKKSDLTVCGNSYTLSIDNTGDATSPLFFPELEYEWFKGVASNPGSPIPNQTKSTLLVTEPGTYFAKVKYGSCSNDIGISEANSNEVTIAFSPLPVNATLSNSGTNDLCDGNARTLSVNLPNTAPNTFKWIKDGVVIEDQTSNQFTTSENGTYALNVFNGVCSFDTNAIVLAGAEGAVKVMITPTGTEKKGVIYIEKPVDFPLPVRLEADKDINVTWLYNGTVVSPRKINNKIYEYQVKKSETKEFRIEITPTTGDCREKKIIVFVVGDGGDIPIPPGEVVPNIVTPNNDGLNDKWNLTEEYFDKDFVKVQIMDSRGKLLIDTTNYKNNWPEDEFNVPNSDSVYYYIIYEDNTPVKQGSITVLK